MIEWTTPRRARIAITLGLALASSCFAEPVAIAAARFGALASLVAWTIAACAAMAACAASLLARPSAILGIVLASPFTALEQLLYWRIGRTLGIVVAAIVVLLPLQRACPGLPPLDLAPLHAWPGPAILVWVLVREWNRREAKELDRWLAALGGQRNDARDREITTPILARLAFLLALSAAIASRTATPYAEITIALTAWLAIAISAWCALHTARIALLLRGARLIAIESTAPALLPGRLELLATRDRGDPYRGAIPLGRVPRAHRSRLLALAIGCALTAAFAITALR